ncbi:MAG TPA: hypothetical protein VEB19_10850 [Gemmatimonadaceae bacterium]|nr:hypothetical protein [Gemmatimonadaceae bacterium]
MRGSLELHMAFEEHDKCLTEACHAKFAEEALAVCMNRVLGNAERRRHRYDTIVADG